MTIDSSNKPRIQPESFRGRSLQASLTVNDLQKSRDWYRDVLGFTVDREMERNGKIASISLKAGDVRVLLNQDDGAKGANRVKGEGFSFMITTTQDVDALAQRVRDYGAPFDTEPMDTRWGTRMFRVRDPDGFKFTISTERPS
ncbi:MAG TPA: VOC family protein [Gemmatimonadaceae bacterium]|nr:VOC family protein [Gemmatimonadaceae bacterium]